MGVAHVPTVHLAILGLDAPNRGQSGYHVLRHRYLAGRRGNLQQNTLPIISHYVTDVAGDFKTSAVWCAESISIETSVRNLSAPPVPQRPSIAIAWGLRDSMAAVGLSIAGSRPNRSSLKISSQGMSIRGEGMAHSSLMLWPDGLEAESNSSTARSRGRSRPPPTPKRPAPKPPAPTACRRRCRSGGPPRAPPSS